MTRYYILLLFLVACGQDYVDQYESTDLEDSINHSDMMEQLRQKKLLREQMALFEIDSISKYAKEITVLNSIKVINLKNNMQRIRDSLVSVLEVEHALVHKLLQQPRDSINLIDSIVWHHDTINHHHYDTILIGRDRKGIYHKLLLNEKE